MWVLRPHHSDSTSKHNKLDCSHLRLKAAHAARSRRYLGTRDFSHRLYQLRRVSLGSYLRVLRHRRRSWGHSPRAFNHHWHRSVRAFNQRWHRSLRVFNHHWHYSRPDFNHLWHLNQLDFNRLWYLNRLVSSRLWHLNRLVSSRRWHLNRLASSHRSHHILRALVVQCHHSGEVARHPCHLFLPYPHHSRTARLDSYNPVSDLLHSVLTLHCAEHVLYIQNLQGSTPVLDYRRSVTAFPRQFRNHHPRGRPRRTRTRRTCSLL